MELPDYESRRRSCVNGRVTRIRIGFVALGLTLAVAGGADERDSYFSVSGAELALPEESAETELSGSALRRIADGWPPDLVIAPIPGRSPQLGWKLGLAGGYFLEFDGEEEGTDVPPSIVGGYAMAAENGSYLYGAGAKFNLLDDKLRLSGGIGYADIRYQFYGIGNDAGDRDIGIDILQDGHLYFAEASWRVWRSAYVGLGLLGGQMDTRPRFRLPENQAFIDPVLSLDLGAITMPISIDTRDDEQFPREGWLVRTRWTLYREAAGSDFNTETFKFSANHYRPVRGSDVLATRVMVRSTSDDAPFFILSSFGGGTDLRGYPSGRYRDRMMYAVQSEYRWQLNDSWILTGFAGFGEVAGSVSDFGNNFLPAGGVGARYVLSKKHRVSLSADVAVGNDGAEFYFGVGEAF